MPDKERYTGPPGLGLGMRMPLSPCESSIASKPQNHEGHSLQTPHSAKEEEEQQQQQVQEQERK